jgi:hypothetical protein
MSYNITKQEHGRTRHEIDLARFTADLARELGGSMVAAQHGEHYIAFEGFKISLNDGWRQSERGKAIVGIRELEWKWLGSDEPSGERFRFPSIRVSVDRPLDKIAADIKRRLIEPAGPIAEARKAHADKIAGSRSDLASVAAKLRTNWPSLSVRHDADASYSGSIHRNANNGPYLDGRFYNDGRVSIDRLGTLSADQFERLMRALYM